MPQPIYPAPIPGLEPCWAVFEQDPVLYLDITEPIARGDGKLVDACPGGALVQLHTFDKPGQQPGYSMSAQDLPTALRFLEQLPQDVDFIMVHEDFYLPEIQARFHLDIGKPCYQAAYLGKPFHDQDTPFDVHPLTEAHLPTVLKYYDLEEPDYLAYLVQTGGMLGAFENGELLGFMGRHAEGSLGILEVLPQHRRRGVAQVLEKAMFDRELALGHVPFGQVFSENAPSLALQQRMGLTLSQGTLRWMLVL